MGSDTLRNYVVIPLMLLNAGLFFIMISITARPLLMSFFNWMESTWYGSVFAFLGMVFFILFARLLLGVTTHSGGNMYG